MKYRRKGQSCSLRWQMGNTCGKQQVPDKIGRTALRTPPCHCVLPLPLPLAAAGPAAAAAAATAPLVEFVELSQAFQSSPAALAYATRPAGGTSMKFAMLAAGQKRVPDQRVAGTACCTLLRHCTAEREGGEGRAGHQHELTYQGVPTQWF